VPGQTTCLERRPSSNAEEWRKKANGNLPNEAPPPREGRYTGRKKKTEASDGKKINTKHPLTPWVSANASDTTGLGRY